VCCCQKAPTHENNVANDDAAVVGMEGGAALITLAQIITADKPASMRAQVKNVSFGFALLIFLFSIF
jgi:hypothetical protein